MLKQFTSRFLALCLAATLFAALLCPAMVASAASKTFRIHEGNIVIAPDGDGLSVTVGEKRTTLLAGTEIIIEGADTTTKNTIRICDNVTASVTLSGVRIESTGFLSAPLELCSAENVTLTLVGANSLNAPEYMAALQVNRYANLTITGEGSLSARGGISAAGIGGGWKSKTAGSPSGSITIGGSVLVSAYGGDFGAGIGGGEGGASGSITIQDSARVYALGGKEAAGIGSGLGARSRTITVTGHAIVEAAGGESGAGIGSAKGGAASKININDYASVRASGGESGAGIGTGLGGSGTMISLSGNALVRARGGEGAAAIGAGKDASLSVGVSVSDFASVFAMGGKGAAGIGGSNVSAGNLSFSGSALVEAYGGSYGAGIGSGKGGNVSNITADSRVSLYAFGGLNAAGIGTGESGLYEKISISGFATVNTLGGKYGAGLGGGKNAVCGKLSIFENATVTAQGGNFGAGIGTGAKNAPDHAPSAGNIYIYGDASVRAAGGKDAAGVGGGLYAAGGRVIVSDTAALDSYDNLTVEPDHGGQGGSATVADYSIVESAIAKVPKNLSEYTEQSVEILENAIKEVIYDLPSTQQAQVDAYAASIERAISVLVKKTVTRKLTPAKKTFESGETVVIKWEGAKSPKDRIIVLKKGHLPTEDEIDPELNVSYGTPLLSAYCKKNGKLAAKGTAKLNIDKNHFLQNLGYAGLPEGKYTAYLCLDGEDDPVALANFSVKGTAMIDADYSEVEEALAKIPQDPTLYTEDSWKTLTDAIDAVEYNLKGEDQARVDGFAKAIRDAIAALTLKTPAPVTDDSKTAEQAGYAQPKQEDEPYTVSLLTQESTRKEARLLLLAQSSGKPEKFGWGVLSTQSKNIETVGKDSIVSAINFASADEDILVGESEKFDTKGIPADRIGAGAGCTMAGSLSVGDTALFNNAPVAATVTLEYGASIGTLSFDYPAGEHFTLPEELTCPGYIFQGWFTDESKTSPASGEFTLSGDLTFYADWDIVPVSIAKDFQFSSAALGVEYSDRLMLQEASSNFNVTLSSGELPSGLALDAETGTIFGTPTDLGTFEFTLLIVDANGTRTEQDYSITVFQSVDMQFVFYTSENAHAATEGDISFYFTYHDRATGILKQSETIELSKALRALDAKALTPSSVDTMTLTLGAYIGEPVQLFFTNSSNEDGWKIDRVVISSEGGDGMPAFEKNYQINAWIDHIDDASFFESGIFPLFLILVVILVLIVVVLVLLRLRSKKNAAKRRETPSAPKTPRTAPTPRTVSVPKQTAQNTKKTPPPKK